METKKMILSIMVLLTGALGAMAQESTHWQCDIHGYEYDMTVYFRLQQGEEVITDYSDYEVAAFVGSECRGVSEIQTVTKSDDSKVQYGYLRIRSNQPEGESVTFKAYQSSKHKTLYLKETISFKSLGVEGLPSAPLILTVGDAIKGDANGDGTVNAADIVEVVNYIMGNPSEIFEEGPADMNDDSSINAADIVMIVNYIMGN